MTRRARLSKYSRRTSSGGRRGGKVWIVILSVVAFLLLSVTVSVAVGLALGERAQEYEDSLPPLNISVGDRYSGNKTVKAVDAAKFDLGYDASYYVSIGIKDLSICLRDSDGFIAYHSAVDVSFGSETDMGSRDLSVEIGKINDVGGYVCAYVYSNALSESDPYIREIKKTYELALIHEIAESGADDILIVGVEINGENIAEAEDFISRAAISAGNANLGVLFGAEVFEDNESLVRRVDAVCDYLAIDLRQVSKNANAVADGEDAPPLYKTLDKLKYFVKVYRARIVFGTENSNLADSARRWGVTNLQIIE